MGEFSCSLKVVDLVVETEATFYAISTWVAPLFMLMVILLKWGLSYISRPREPFP